jgi:CheY-like chemotaxis protein
MTSEPKLTSGLTAQELEDTIQLSQEMVQHLLEIIGEALGEAEQLRRDNRILRNLLSQYHIALPIMPAIGPSLLEIEAFLESRAAADEGMQPPHVHEEEDEPTAPDTFVPPRPEGHPAGGILIVDDSEILQLRLRSIIEPLGYPIAGYAGTGVEGIRLALELLPRVVVLDFNLPELNGLQVAQRLQADAPGIHIIVCAAELDAVLTQALHAAGVREVLSKPIQLDALVRALKRAMEE